MGLLGLILVEDNGDFPMQAQFGGGGKISPQWGGVQGSVQVWGRTGPNVWTGV